MTYSMAMVILRSAPHSSTWLHQLLVANLGTLRDTVVCFWCNFQPCYVVLNIKKTRLKFYCDCWCPRCKKAFWKNSSPWTLTSKVIIWLGNHFFLSLRWGFNHFRCWKFFFSWSSPPPPPPNSRPPILDKTVEKIVYLDSIFSKHRSCAGSSLSLFPWKQCCCVFKRKPEPWAFVGSNIELGEGDFSPQYVVLEIVLLRRKVDMMGKTFSSSFVRDWRLQLFFIWSGK